MVVLDIKQENYELTSGFRQKYGQEIYLFNPFAEDRHTHRWNPLTYVSDDPDFRVSAFPEPPRIASSWRSVPCWTASRI